MDSAIRAEPGLWAILAYGVGEIANAIKVVTFGLYSLFFATTVMALPGTWIGVVGFLAMFWDAIIDPFIGFRADGVQARSRRYTFMMIGALTMGIGFWAFFSPPRNLSTVALFAWLLAASLVVRTATSMYSIPYAAVGASLSQDYHRRITITAIRGIAATLGTLATASLSFILFFPEKVPGVDPKLNIAGYSSMGLAFGIVMTLAALLGTIAVRYCPDTAPEEAPQAPGTFFGSMAESLRNPSFRIMLISFCIVVIGLTVNSSLLIHYLKYYMEVNGSAAMSSAQGAFFGAGLLGIGFWLRMSRKFGKHRLYVFSAAITSLLTLAAQPLFGKGHLLGTGDVRPFLIGYGIAGFFNCILWFMPQAMLADVADEAELRTGIRPEGALFGMLSFAQQVATGIAIMLAGLLLDTFVGLIPGSSSQSEETVRRIGMLYSVVPAALFMTAALLMRRYKLTRERVASIQSELRERKLHQELSNVTNG